MTDLFAAAKREGLHILAFHGEQAEKTMAVLRMLQDGGAIFSEAELATLTAAAMRFHAAVLDVQMIAARQAAESEERS